MKKGLSIFLTVVYLVLISGITIQLHYCGGKLASVKLALIDSSHSCSCGSKIMKKGCCKNQSISIKIQGDQKISTNSLIPSDNGKVILPQLLCEIYDLTIKKYFSTIANYHAPPPRYSNSLQIYNSTFRI